MSPEQQSTQIQRDLKTAVSHHNSGRLAEAAAIYAHILAASPDHPVALRLSGLAAVQQGKLEAGLDRLSRAVAMAPNSAEAQSNLGTGMVAAKRFDEAADAFRRAINLNPANAGDHHNLGAALIRSGKFDEAVKVLRTAIDAHPDNVLLLNNLGNAYVQLKEFERAADTYATATRIDPGYVDAWYNLGTANLRLNRPTEATTAFVEAVRIDPRRSDAWYNLAAAYKRDGRLPDALEAYRACLSARPEFAQAWVDFGLVLEKVGHAEEAMAAYRRAISIDAENVDAMNNLGHALGRAGKFALAEETLRDAIDIDPESPESRNNLGVIHQMMGDVDEAMKEFRAALELDPDKLFAEKNLLFAALNHPNLSSEELLDIHVEQGRRHTQPGTETKFASRVADPDKRLKIGYLSSDFHDHPVGHNIFPLLQHHDECAHEIHLYAELERTDAITEQFQALADWWTPVTDMNDEDVARRIEEDGIDILVTTAGRFNLNRRHVAPYRPAPVQISFHDCATTGLAAMDYWLTDTRLHPENTAERFTETLWRLPCFYQFTAPTGFPEPAASTDGDEVIFGSFSKPEKITPKVVALWARVLEAIPNARLMLKYQNAFADPDFRDRWKRRFAGHGIKADRLIFGHSSHERADHLRLYNKVDIALDPFPFNGATTTFEALAMGVPVITLNGRHFVDRVSGAMLGHLELENLIAKDETAFVDLARDLSSNTAYRAELRRGLRDRLIASPLCDGASYAASVEAAYREMWHRWCKNPK